METATELDAESLAMPALGTGSAQVDPQRAADDIFQAIRDFIDETHSKMEIRVVIYQEEMYGVFERSWRRTFDTSRLDDST